MNAFLAEMIGTMILVTLGDGVVANVLLHKSKGNGGGWIVITAGWAFAVAVAVYCVGTISGGHLNPAVTIGLAVIGNFSWALVPGYVAAQMLGAMFGAALVWLAYLPHWGITEDKAAVRGVFCTAPAVRHGLGNLITEMIGTFILVLGALAIPSKANLPEVTGFSTGFGPFLIGVLVWSIGLSLGGPTGYAINPARDLGPRLAHALLPIPGKAASDWGYAWIPVVGPILGGVAGAVFYKTFWPG
jgi:glycerol uptake facilitator protein